MQKQKTVYWFKRLLYKVEHFEVTIDLDTLKRRGRIFKITIGLYVAVLTIAAIFTLIYFS